MNFKSLQWLPKILILFFISGLNPSFGKDKVVAIIDTGLNLSDHRFSGHLCISGHRDFTNTGLQDRHGHGTHIFGIIQQYAPNDGWCAVIIKYFNKNPSRKVALKAYAEAYLYLLELKPDYVNFSGDGAVKMVEDEAAIRLLSKTKFIVAVGNDSLDLSKQSTYPASYFLPNITPVGSIRKNGRRSKFSNWGLPYVRNEQGENVLSYLPCDIIGGVSSEMGCVGYMSGTSQATAIATGKILSDDLLKAVDRKPSSR